jgi:predicted HAD superfamily Cof-like phosphohydrolase
MLTTMVREFHEKFDVYTQGQPAFPPDEIAILRLGLIREEMDELEAAVVSANLVEVADAFADLLYVTCGAALAFGIPIDEVLAEVHRSNMSKLGRDGKPVLRSDGKVLKGPGFTPPDLAPILLAATCRSSWRLAWRKLPPLRSNPSRETSASSNTE